MATQLDLSGTGTFETPAIVDFLGLAYPLSGTSVQIRFALEGGSELHLPIKSDALYKFIEQFRLLSIKKE
jgi:hypothetical protein